MCRAESYLSKRRLKKYHLMGFGLNPNKPHQVVQQIQTEEKKQKKGNSLSKFIFSVCMIEFGLTPHHPGHIR